MPLQETSRDGKNACSPQILHTKLVASEKTVSLSSTNITKKAFSQLSELNLCVSRENSAFLDELLASVRETVEESCRISDPREITYRRPIAFLAGIMV